MEFTEQNSTNFSLALKTTLNNLSYDKKKEFLSYHQFLAVNYMINNTRIRGILLYFQMGLGKSMVAVAVADYFRSTEPSRKIVILLAKSIQENFKDNIYKFIQQDDPNADESKVDDIIGKDFNFVSLNASNVIDQMSYIGKPKETILFEKQLEDFRSKVDLDNSLLIIDEAHNLFNSITNGSKNAIKLYDTIMNAKNIKLIFLTGTPIVNHPFELVSCFNMLRGPVYLDSQQNKSVTLLPELKDDFDNYFIDYQKNKIKNKKRFENRIVGLVGYFGDYYSEDNNKKEGFPIEHPIIIEKIPMSVEQFTYYSLMRDLERDEQTFSSKKAVGERFNVSSSSTSSYRVKSRQASNFVFPKQAIETPNIKKARIKHMNKITSTDLTNLKKYSPKLDLLLKNVQKHNFTLGVIYSNFVKNEGIEIIKKSLETIYNYKNYNTLLKSEEELEIYGLYKNKNKDNKSKKKVTTLYYAEITGQVLPEDRARYIKAFNAKENIHGEHIQLLLISGAASEGLDLKNVRHIHIFEPFWNYARIKQIIARGNRYKSHILLPKNEQNIQPYIYLSTYPVGYNIDKQKKINKFELTTDVDLYEKSLKNYTLIDTFMRTLVTSSFDCSAHHKNLSEKLKKKIQCHLCTPTNQPLYHPIIEKDFSLPNPCIPLKTQELTAKELVMEDTGEKFYYTIDDNNPTIYVFSKEIDGFIVMGQDNKYYPILVEKILDL